MIGIIGFGRFGKLMARHLAADFEVAVNDPRAAAGEIVAVGASQGTFEAVCGRKVVIAAVPISEMQTVLRAMAPHLAPGTLVADVCSVKILPVQWMRAILPESVHILATHPMFGPDSAADSLAGRKIVLCRERLADRSYEKIQAYLLSKGLEVIEATPDAHDREIAVSLALTHMIGRALSAFGARSQKIDTEGYRRLLHILEVVTHDTWQLFEDMHRYNPHAPGCRDAFMRAMSEIAGTLG